jgi:cytochrome c oxidase cbb3-type subunit 3
VAKIEKDSVSGVETTGHEWDGIKELNTPLPRWWLYVFYACIAWAVVYWVFFPAWPTGKDYTHGLFGWSQRAELEQVMADARKGQAKFLDRINASTLEQIRADKDLLNFALAGGKAAFAVNCVQCHGAGGQGNPGFPNLADDEWLWSGSLAGIYQTIQHGIRATDDGETRGAGITMPAWASDSAPVKLTSAQIGDVADYLVSLSGKPGDAAATGRGKALFAENCVACHGEKAEGNPDMGAPGLADGLWLYGGDRKTLVQTITAGRAGVMPAWSKRLDDATIKQLAVYIHELGGGK